ncbi:MAG: LLM class flavin-dependent oxidoreductase [Acidimicrobiales bacterium]
MVAGDAMTPEALVAHACRLESMEYPSIWLTDIFGREIYVTAAHLLASTSTIKVASGIAHIYGRDPIASEQAGRTLSDLSGGRFIQGLGVSHPIAAEMRGVRWENPVAKMRDYVLAMRGESPIHTPGPNLAPPIFIAAHGPKMMAVAAEVADGANTYMQPPAHTEESRDLLGPEKELHVVLPSCLTTDAEVGRSAGRRALSIYLPLPAYQRQWAKRGFTSADWSDGGSDRLIDTYINWGDLDGVVGRMQDHLSAGATGITLGALPPDPADSSSAWELIEAVAPGRVATETC